MMGEDDQTTIEGITIKNGLRESSGGIWCVGSHMTIANCIFLKNEVEHDAGAIGLAAAASPTIVNCQFIRNKTADAVLCSHNRGAAIYMWGHTEAQR
jgi:hypothetical protein